jgi:drug/metabolite transporter (DMT)-like permease
MRNQNKTFAYMEIVISLLIVGSTSIIGKVLTNSLPIFLVNGLSLIVASIIYLIIILLKKVDIFKISRRDYFIIFLVGFFGTFLYRIAFFYGLKYTSASEAGIISSSLPAVFGFGTYILLKEKLTRNQIKGIIFSVIGLLLINFNSAIGFSISTKQIIGNGLVFFSVIMGALFTIISGFLSRKITPLMISSLTSFFSALLFLPFMIIDLNKFNLFSISYKGFLLIIYYAIFVTVISFLLWFDSLKTISISTAGVFTSLIPLTSIVLGFVILKESLNLNQIIGAIFILISIVMISKANPNKNNY